MNDVSGKDRARGALYGLGAVCIWASFLVVSRLAVTTNLTPWDVTAIRYTIAGVLLLPYLLRKGLAFDRLGWGGLALVVIGCGAPLVLLVNIGLLFAPAARAGALYPGVSPLIVACLAAIVLKERLSLTKWIAVVVIAISAATMLLDRSGAQVSPMRPVGDAFFLAAALAWASFTIVLRRTGLEGLHAAAIAAVGSLILYLPPYAIIQRESVFQAPVDAIALQAVIQGVLTAIVALLLYGRSVAILGATGGAAFVALNPVLTGLAAIPVLSEWPTAHEWLSIVAISAGVYILSGGRARFFTSS